MPEAKALWIFNRFSNWMAMLRLFNIQRYSVHDGRGIRTTVFLKGCPLRCAWCSNPESQRFGFENTFTPSTCIGCNRCVTACPTGALSAIDSFDPAKCTDCFECEQACPTASRKIIGRDWQIDDVVDEALKDSAFYKTSGGGVTLSGGEPLAQPAAALELAKALKRAGLHLAIETCGHAKWSDVEAVLSHCDQILFDLKMMDSAKHKEFTGVGNELILENVRKAAQLNKELIIRVPVIGGYNNDPENIRATAQFAAEIGAAELHLLPFHRFGENKYKKSGMEYHCTAHTPSDSEMNNLLQIVQSYKISAKIGG
jgi:pyruvate formate lyase activating enzyme